jgi:diguanylate cyclase (GGDEF)-like protein/putative nucleotidyltransferase with HDIG domain
MIWHPSDSVETYGVGQAAVTRRRSEAKHPSQAPAIARAFALLGFGAALVGFLGVLLPHPSEFNEPVIHATQGVALVVSAFLFVFADRLPLWVISITPAIAVVNTSVAVLATHDPTSGYAFFYVWIAIICFYFLSRRETILQITWAIANYAAVVLLTGPPAGAADQESYFFVLVAGTLVAAAAPLLYLRGRFDDLLEQLSDAARTDLLTGLANGRGLQEAVAAELERARLSGSKVSLLVADLDRFKDVNERLGHKAGDELLRRIGTMFDEATRRMDVVARSGGSEYTVLLPETGEDDAYLVAEQLLGRVRRGFRDEFMPLTTSIGVATYPIHAITAEELLKLADQALIAAKVMGRDRAVVSNPEVTNILAGTVRRRPLDPQAHLATMLSLAEALDLRDSGTASHSTTVAEYARMMARELGLSAQRTERVRLAGILHDIGKVGIPDSILQKPGPLDEAEWEQMRRHPEFGARILGTRELVDIREWVLASHERPDGKGYPRGLRGDEIPLEARIVSVADAYEAMIGDRIYRVALTEAEARAELRGCAGTQFDPEVVDAFLRVLDRAESPAMPGLAVESTQ